MRIRLNQTGSSPTTPAPRRDGPALPENARKQDACPSADSITLGDDFTFWMDHFSIRCHHCQQEMQPQLTPETGWLHRVFLCRKNDGQTACPLGAVDEEALVMAVIGRLHALVRTTGDGVADWRGESGPTGREVVEALRWLDRQWDDLFPIEQKRYAGLLFEGVEVTRDTIAVRPRSGGLAALVREWEKDRHPIAQGPQHSLNPWPSP